VISKCKERYIIPASLYEYRYVQYKESHDDVPDVDDRRAQ
jgi:hypothetical protein